MNTDSEKSSYKDILRSTSIFGGSQIIEILVRIIRTKIIALLLGPVGVGLIGLYRSTIDLIRSVTGLGLDFSAVRDIAEANGSDNDVILSKTVRIVHRWVWFTGMCGTIIMLGFSKALSLHTFGNENYTLGFAILSVVLLFESIKRGQLALLQGLRKVLMMAKAKILGVIAGFIFSIPLYWVFRINGIVPAIVISSFVSLTFAWYFSKKIKIKAVHIDLKDTYKDGIGMIRLGSFIVIASLAGTAAMYFIRSFISKKAGLADVGHFQAAWNLSSVYLTAILQAMGTDYFPRLSAVQNNNVMVNKLVNEQTEIALLISGPIIVFMLSFIGSIVILLYSTEFNSTIDILHWQLVGTFFKVISWPIAFIFLSKGLGSLVAFFQISLHVILVALIYYFWDITGIQITGISFLFSYIYYVLVVIGGAHFICNFKFSKNSIKILTVYAIIITFAFLNSKFITGFTSYSVGTVISLISVLYSYNKLRKLVDIKKILNNLTKR